MPAEAVGPLMRGIAVIQALTEAGGARTVPTGAQRVDAYRSATA